MDCSRLTERLEIALGTLPANLRSVLSFRYGLGEADRLPPDEIAKRIGTAPEQIVEMEAFAIRKLRRPSLCRPVVEALGRLNQDIWTAISRKVSPEDSFIYKESSLAEASKKLPGEVLLAIDCKYTDLQAWIQDFASEVDEAWYRSRFPNEIVTNAVARLREIDGQNRFPLEVRSLLEMFQCNLPFLRFVIPLCRLNLGFYHRYVARQPLSTSPMRSIRIHLDLVARRTAQSIPLQGIVEEYNRRYGDDGITGEIAEKCMTARPHLFKETADKEWSAVSTGVETPSHGAATESDEERSLYFERPWSETTASDLIKEILEPLEFARFGEVAKIFMRRAGERYSLPMVLAALVSSEDIVQVSPRNFALREKYDEIDRMTATSARLLNRADCKRFLMDRYAGEPLGSYALWTPAMEREWCYWAEANSERNTKTGFGGDSDRANNRRLYESLLYVADPSRWPIQDAEKQAWAFKKACQATYHFKGDVAGKLWTRAPTLQDLFSAADAARRLGYLNWIRVNRALSLEDHSPKCAPTLAVLIALEMVAPAEHWQAKHHLGPRLEDSLAMMVKEIKKKGFLHWRDEAGMGLRKHLSRRGALKHAGWVEPKNVEVLLAAVEGEEAGPARHEEDSSQESIDASEPVENPAPRQMGLPF